MYLLCCEERQKLVSALVSVTKDGSLISGGVWEVIIVNFIVILIDEM